MNCKPSVIKEKKNYIECVEILKITEIHLEKKKGKMLSNM